MLRVALVLGLVVVVTGSGAARADVSSTAAAETTAEAKKYFEQGASAFRAGRYQRAVELFRRADELAPRAALSFNIARAHEGLGERDLAVSEYREYLRRDPSAENGRWVRQRIQALEPPPPEPKSDQVASSVPATAPPAVVVTEDRADIEAQPARDAPTLVQTAGPPSPLPWITLGTGGALLIAAGGLELARRDTEADARRAQTQIELAEQLSEMRQQATAARICAGAGAALFVVGGVLVAVDLAQPSSKVRVSAGCSPEGCIGTLRGQL